jgi:hypothetical protein
MVIPIDLRPKNRTINWYNQLWKTLEKRDIFHAANGHDGEGHERLLNGVELDHQKAYCQEHPLPARCCRLVIAHPIAAPDLKQKPSMPVLEHLKRNGRKYA